MQKKRNLKNMLSPKNTKTKKKSPSKKSMKAKKSVTAVKKKSVTRAKTTKSKTPIPTKQAATKKSSKSVTPKKKLKSSSTLKKGTKQVDMTKKFTSLKVKKKPKAGSKKKEIDLTPSTNRKLFTFHGSLDIQMDKIKIEAGMKLFDGMELSVDQDNNVTGRSAIVYTINGGDEIVHPLTPKMTEAILKIMRII